MGVITKQIQLGSHYGVIKTLNKLHKMKRNKRESKKHLIEPQGTIFGFIAFVYWEKATLSECQMISSILSFISCTTIMFRQRVHSFPFPFQKKRRRKKKNKEDLGHIHSL